MGLGYNKNVLYGLYTFDKTSKVFIFNICCFYTTSLALMLVSISQFTAIIHAFQNGDCLPSWILKFSQFLSKNSNYHLFLRSQVKFGEDRTICGRVIAYF